MEGPQLASGSLVLELIGGIVPGALGARLRKQAEWICRDFRALKDISFELKKGESMGIIGRNGSGESTLLQLVKGTLQPTSGQVRVNGRVAALLELGSGFNPDFTRRENVYLNGAVLGFSRKEIDARFESIAAFADVGEFIDEPVKTYSSGMMIRLAFAVAFSVEPEVLIVDKALSVGDIFFQQKCFTRVHEMLERGVQPPPGLARHGRGPEPLLPGAAPRAGRGEEPGAAGGGGQPVFRVLGAEGRKARAPRDCGGGDGPEREAERAA